MEEERPMAGAAKLRRGLSLRKGGGSCASSIPSWGQPKNSSSSHGQRRRSFSGCGDVVSARKLGANMWGNLDFGPVEVRKDVKQRRKEEMEMGFMSGDFCHHGACDEVTAYHRSRTQTTLALHGRRKENGCTLSTSTELMKMLNRIWALEEQQESNISVIKELRAELKHARARIKDLVQDQVADRQMIGELLNKIPEEESVREIREKEMIKVAVRTVEGELEMERKSRRRLETLHQKLVEEISELKSHHGKTMQDLERERKIRALLDDLCDEFAEGILCCEERMRELSCRLGKDCAPCSHQLMLHVSETWLDKRLQWKVAEDHGDAEEFDAILAQLRWDVDAQRRDSHEAIPLHGIVGVPQDEGSTSGIQGFEQLNMSDGSVINSNSNLDTLSDQREAVGGVRRSSSVRDKIGFFENIVCHRGDK